ncbi:UNVERIFIED_CONTAM: putative thiamine biosynthetic bifunctional enzyme, chloroplastic [Sesamum radiatum]|uniref:Thiamine biosynthetic bifunctional enzyme, chloroplastic n=1 Tax=Sesamum radiatum TaxID=300843 RepID=A0AAW2MXJ9_SESRA
MQQEEELKPSGRVRIPHVLTVAGSDSGAGAGIQADIKACAARGVYCSTVITAVTAQNTVGVQGVNIVTEDFVREQLNSVLSDMRPDVVKTGMLPSPGIVKVLCQSLKEFQVGGIGSNISQSTLSFFKLFLIVFGFSVDNMNFMKEALVVDPVMVSTSGDVLAGSSILASFR